MKQRKVRCQYCGALASLRPDSVVWGAAARGGKLYICDRYPVCDAYVGVHQKSLQPLGTLANRELRQKRRRAHEVLGALWTMGLMEKKQAYIWMQARLSLTASQAHIGKFTAYMCDVLMAECEAFLANNNLAA